MLTLLLCFLLSTKTKEHAFLIPLSGQNFTALGFFMRTGAGQKSRNVASSTRSSLPSRLTIIPFARIVTFFARTTRASPIFVCQPSIKAGSSRGISIRGTFLTTTTSKYPSSSFASGATRMPPPMHLPVGDFHNGAGLMRCLEPPSIRNVRLERLIPPQHGEHGLSVCLLARIDGFQLLGLLQHGHVEPRSGDVEKALAVHPCRSRFRTGSPAKLRSQTPPSGFSADETRAQNRCPFHPAQRKTSRPVWQSSPATSQIVPSPPMQTTASAARPPAAARVWASRVAVACRFQIYGFPPPARRSAP